MPRAKGKRETLSARKPVVAHTAQTMFSVMDCARSRVPFETSASRSASFFWTHHGNATLLTQRLKKTPRNKWLRDHSGYALSSYLQNGVAKSEILKLDEKHLAVYDTARLTCVALQNIDGRIEISVPEFLAPFDGETILAKANSM